MSDRIWMGTNPLNQRVIANINRAGKVVPSNPIEGVVEATGPLRDVFEKAGELADPHEMPRLGRLGEMARDLRSSFRPDGPVLGNMMKLGKAAGFLSLAVDLVQDGAELMEIYNDPNLTDEQRSAQIQQKAIEMVFDTAVGTVLGTAGAVIGSFAGPPGVICGLVLASSLKEKLSEGFHEMLEHDRIASEPVYG